MLSHDCFGHQPPVHCAHPINSNIFVRNHSNNITHGTIIQLYVPFLGVVAVPVPDESDPIQFPPPLPPLRMKILAVRLQLRLAWLCWPMTILFDSILVPRSTNVVLL